MPNYKVTLDNHRINYLVDSLIADTNLGDKIYTHYVDSINVEYFRNIVDSLEQNGLPRWELGDGYASLPDRITAAYYAGFEEAISDYRAHDFKIADCCGDAYAILQSRTRTPFLKVPSSKKNWIVYLVYNDILKSRWGVQITYPPPKISKGGLSYTISESYRDGYNSIALPFLQSYFGYDLRNKARGLVEEYVWKYGWKNQNNW